MIWDFLLVNWVWVVLALLSGSSLFILSMREYLVPFYVTPMQAVRLMNDQVSFVMYDLQVAPQKTILGARPLSMEQFLSLKEGKKSELLQWKKRKVILFCEDGSKSTQLGYKLQHLGFTSIYVIHGGIGAWEQAGLPIRKLNTTDEPKRDDN